LQGEEREKERENSTTTTPVKETTIGQFNDHQTFERDNSQPILTARKSRTYR